MIDSQAMHIEAERAAAAKLAQVQSAALRELAVPPEQALAAFVMPESAKLAAVAPSSPTAPPTKIEPGWWSVGEIAAAYRSGMATPASLLDALLERTTTTTTAER